jgi:hypothetical protein
MESSDVTRDRRRVQVLRGNGAHRQVVRAAGQQGTDKLFMPGANGEM